MHIQTKNLLLRDFSIQDLPLYTALRSHPDFQTYYDDDDITPEKSAFLLQLFIQQSQESPRQKFQLAICDKDGVVMGSCGIRLEAEGQASIGFELGVPWQRKGRAKEAAQAMLEFAFCDLRVDRVYAETLAENLGASRLCQSLGMRRVEVGIGIATRYFKGKNWQAAVFEIYAQDFITLTKDCQEHAG
ncbi:GNAT family N-acetyltransferase [Undibacterium pigrum]|uniref:RimJ/RimL family protein N-acetyltransferase n=1 Tax=Undibacterium pigrum TaxID=401470 RepID=A0A318IWX2_9BURK|nr:GNAT family N-acetyltransferase [Undibacterium pigrum]PXX39815.1 RimJ/RimL family protein N-acetyltransferase [Undibacterium pigrum]